jgi:hypothetical protein
VRQPPLEKVLSDINAEKETKTPLAIAVDRGLQYLAAAHRRPIENVRGRYRSNRQFCWRWRAGLRGRRCVEVSAKQR